MKMIDLRKMTWTKFAESAKVDEKCAQNFG